MALRLTTILFLLIVLAGCEEPVPAAESINIDVIVVSGVMTNENESHIIRLSKSHQALNAIAAPVKGAEIVIETETSTIAVTEMADSSGVYLTEPFRAITGAPYTVVVHHDGKEYSGTDEAAAVESLSAIDIAGDGNSFKVNFKESGTQPNYIEYYFDWSTTPSCSSGSCHGYVVYYDLKTIDVNNVFKPKQTDFTFPKGTRIVRRKFSVSPAYREFLRGMLQETAWSGGVFGVTRANVSTNLSGGAVGFFGVSTVVSDTTIVQ